MLPEPPRLRCLFASFVAVLCLSGNVTRGVKAADRTLPPWTPGTLDIHHISTGRGNATLVVGPDGTTILIDAGAGRGEAEVTVPARPDSSRRPGEWIARYVQRQLRATGRDRIDTFVATHLHPDHIGDSTQVLPVSPDGSYLLTGVTDVAALIPIDTVVDRGFPNYRYPGRALAPFAHNYMAFTAARQAAGKAVEKVKVGAVGQIRLRHAPADFPAFAVRTLAANGRVWTGSGEDSASAVPPLETLGANDQPDENMCSIALRVSYGKFDYYTGGDLHHTTDEGANPWRDIETPSARAAGPVEVAVANHHAYFDAVGPDSARALAPRVWVVPVWHATHLNMGPLERMLSQRLYPGPRDIFATDLHPAAELMSRRFLAAVRGRAGHVVIRVPPGGDSFFVFVTDHTTEADRVTDELGPLPCR